VQIMQDAFGGYEREIDDCIERMRRFSHPESGLVFERVPAAGGFDLATQYGRFVNPGHALEGCAFIQRRLRARPDAELLEYVRRTTLKMLEWGWDEELGGIYYRADALGKPQLNNDAVLKAWWPQAEAMTAALGAYELTRDEVFLDWFCKIDAYCDAKLRDAEHPEWFAYAEVDGRRWHSYKGSRFKGFFHVPRHLIDTIEICERLGV
jgi:N-acylglucosamine 2-epimerase